MSFLIAYDRRQFVINNRAGITMEFSIKTKPTTAEILAELKKEIDAELKKAQEENILNSKSNNQRDPHNGY